MKKNNPLLILSFVLLFIFAACSDDETSNGETPNNTETIADFISNDSEYSLLYEAIVRVGLDISLDGTDNFTLLAPNNAAFEEFLAAEEYETISQVPLQILTNVILNHLVVGNISSSNLQGYLNSLAEDQENKLTLYVSNNSSITINGNATVTASDINRSNGVVHGVNAVIAPLTINGMVQAVSDFTVFAELLEAASTDLVDFNEMLSNDEATFTILIPSNEAFQDLFNFMGVSGINDIPSSLLRDILNYHIINVSNLQTTDLEDNQILTTRSEEEITVTIDTVLAFLDAAGIPTEVTTSNIQTINGVVHVLERVLRSEEVLDNIDPTITGWVTLEPTLSTLETALRVTGLDALLDDRNSNYTLLAPNNTAFSEFLQGEDVDDIPVDILTDLLLNHIVLGGTASGDLTNGYLSTQALYNGTTNNLSLYVDTTNGVVFNGISTVLQADIPPANGIIHMVDAVITLPTLLTFATVDPNLNSLESAFTRDDQPNYSATLSESIGTGNTPFTVWAPNNAAFDALLLELGLNDLSEIDGATLTASLNTHIVAQANLRFEDLVTGTLSTLGDDITVNATEGTLTDLNGRISAIQEVNIQASNGVMHKIDMVLLPL